MKREGLAFEPYIYVRYIYGKAHIKNPNYFNYQAFWVDDDTPVEGVPPVRMGKKYDLNIWLLVHYRRLVDDRIDRVILERI